MKKKKKKEKTTVSALNIPSTTRPFSGSHVTSKVSPIVHDFKVDNRLTSLPKQLISPGNGF